MSITMYLHLHDALQWWGEPSCLVGSRLPRGYRASYDWMTAWRVGDMRIGQNRGMTLDHIRKEDWICTSPWREAPWGDERRSTPSWCDLLWPSNSHDVRVSLCTRGQASWSPSRQRLGTDMSCTSSSVTWLPSKHCRMETSLIRKSESSNKRAFAVWTVYFSTDLFICIVCDAA